MEKGKKPQLNVNTNKHIDIEFKSLSTVFDRKESKNKYLLVWDRTNKATCANFFNYTGILVEFHMEVMKAEFKGSKTGVGDACEFLRKYLVRAARVGKKLIINVDKQAPDFINKYKGEKTMLPTDQIFNYEEWRKKENYINIVRANENYDSEIVTWNYHMLDGFTIIVLARYDSDE